jgi:hypothetical protein
MECARSSPGLLAPYGGVPSEDILLNWSLTIFVLCAPKTALCGKQTVVLICSGQACILLEGDRVFEGIV